MRHLFSLLLLFALAGCSATRQLERAQQVIAEHQAQTPPDQQLTDLVTRHPELVGKTVRTVVVRDTVRVPGATVRVTTPAISTPAGDNTLVDSLMRSAARQLHAKDSAAFALRLKAALAARPRLHRDTLVTVVGNLTVRTWVDRHGLPHTQVTSAAQKFAYEKKVHESGPLQPPAKEITRTERLWIFIKDAFWLVVVVLVLTASGIVYYFFKGRRPTNS